MKKIFLIGSLLIIALFLLSCAPQPLTDEELEAELAKLTPEERQELIADLEAKESGALAGQAIKLRPYAKKVSPRVFATSKVRLAKTTIKIEAASSGSASEKPKLKCLDSDGDDPYVSGHASKGVDAPKKDECVSDLELHEAYCDQNNEPNYKQYNCKLENKNNFCKDGRCQFSSTEDKALYDCKKLENKEKEVHYCTEAGNLIFYDRYYCQTFEKGEAVPNKEVSASYNKDSLYPEVDSCAKILEKFKDKPRDAVIGCFDSDSFDIENKGYIEMVTIDGMQNKVKEVDACVGFDFNHDIYINPLDKVVENKCPIGYHQEGYPPAGYKGEEVMSCSITQESSYDSHTYSKVFQGIQLFERKCPSLFENSIPNAANTETVNCAVLKGKFCHSGRCAGAVDNKYIGKEGFKAVKYVLYQYQ